MGIYGVRMICINSAINCSCRSPPSASLLWTVRAFKSVSRCLPQASRGHPLVHFPWRFLFKSVLSHSKGMSSSHFHPPLFHLLLLLCDSISWCFVLHNSSFVMMLHQWTLLTRLYPCWLSLPWTPFWGHIIISGILKQVLICYVISLALSVCKTIFSWIWYVCFWPHS